MGIQAYGGKQSGGYTRTLRREDQAVVVCSVWFVVAVCCVLEVGLVCGPR
jgi:hypothetical protein